MANVKTLIQVVEVWTPSKDRRMLEWNGGLCGPHTAFQAASKSMVFGLDEGLPGRAWAQRHPVIMTDLQVPQFRRAEAAKRAGLSCGVAIPIFAGDFLLAVMVFFCGDDADHVGTIELWHNDAEQSSGLTLQDGYFGQLESFEFISRHTEFRPGFGLPGLVWQAGMPVVMADLGHSHRFVRREDALRAGINKGLGLPFSDIPKHTYVLAFLSALGTPIARRFEIWTPTEDGGTQFLAGDCDRNPDFAAAYQGLVLPLGAGPIGTTRLTGLPCLSGSLSDDATLPSESARQAGMESMATLPVIENGHLKAIVAMYF